MNNCNVSATTIEKDNLNLYVARNDSIKIFIEVGEYNFVKILHFQTLGMYLYNVLCNVIKINTIYKFLKVCYQLLY